MTHRQKPDYDPKPEIGSLWTFVLTGDGYRVIGTIPYRKGDVCYMESTAAYEWKDSDPDHLYVIRLVREDYPPGRVYTLRGDQFFDGRYTPRNEKGAST